ncbi:TRAF3-interacting protein 1 [Metopolophium dirhodum]|uniref:TRAF3-interacting protein 1 n=1 Tax=Metopolophium dirhodum TaxID=44670 RepID=UPI00298FB78C|nr:TRAF3-interacting protein 1 [Metopolophium dirhodum]
MTDSVNKELVKRVQLTLSKYINKPQLTEKLLNKPPFKFLHDIVTNVIQSTGYLTDVFTDEEIISTNVTTKESKIKFLEKLITAIQSTTNKTISARPSKIVAGLEVTKTLELLIAIVFGIETKNKEVKEQISPNTKTKKPETTKINNQNKSKLLEKTKSLEKKVKENIDHDSQKKIQKSDSVESSVVKNDEPVSMEMDTTTKSNGEFSVKPVDEEIKNTVDSSVKTEELIENKLQSANKSKTEKKASESIEKTNPEENPLRKLSETHNISKPLRPKSSRPPAPNRRPQSNTFTEIPKHSDSFFSKNNDKINDIDDNIVTIEVLNDNKSTYDSYTQEDGQGHLVSQILQTQMEFNIKNKTDSSKIEWEGKNVKDQEMLTKEMDTIRQFIQGITKSANPLSKLINNMQENIDQMNRELNYWKNFTEKTNEKLGLQQRVVEEQIKPMVMLLEKLTVEVKDELEMMDYCKANIMKNKSHINYLVSERFMSKN